MCAGVLCCAITSFTRPPHSTRSTAAAAAARARDTPSAIRPPALVEVTGVEGEFGVGLAVETVSTTPYVEKWVRVNWQEQ